MTLVPRVIAEFVALQGAVVLVTVRDVEGSTPREAGAYMLVSLNDLLLTIGGGQLEFLAIDRARKLLRGGEQSARMSVPLGPDIGQCCGGRVVLDFERLDAARTHFLVATAEAAQAALAHVYVFGAGHVGRALAMALSPLPLTITLTDTRRGVLGGLPDTVEKRMSAIPEALVRAAPAGSAFVILTHDHALDFLIAREALERRDAAYVGMIGSQSKRATFKGWFRREGGDLSLLDGLVCPIGSDRIKDKRPEVIAALVTSEIVERLLGRAGNTTSSEAARAARGTKA